MPLTGAAAVSGWRRMGVVEAPSPTAGAVPSLQVDSATHLLFFLFFSEFSPALPVPASRLLVAVWSGALPPA